MPRGPEPRAPACFARWPTQGLCAGAGVGALAALAFVVLSLSRAPRPDALKLLVAAGTTTAGCALALFLLALVTSPLLRWRAGRALAVGVQATLAATFFGVHLTSSVLKAISGSYLTVGAVEFVLAGGPHLLRTIVTSYATSVALLVAAMASVGIVTARFARRALAGAGPSSWPRLAVLAGVASAGLVPAPFTRDLALASPELAFADSFEPEEPEEVAPLPEAVQASGGAPEPPRVEPAPGPSREDGARWAATVKGMQRRRTNVLLLTLESISVRHLGYCGYDRPTTPNLDRIAARSLRLRRAWSTATHSNYAQMAILSSLFPRRTTGLDVYKRLDYPRVLLHDVFHTLGYATGTISSQDESWQGMLRFQTTGTPTFYRHAKDYRGKRFDIGSELVVLDHVTVDIAADWIRRQGAHPWALYVNLQATHFPYRLQTGIPAPFQPTQVTPGKFDYLSYPEQDRQAVVNRYDNALRYVDEQIGKLERALERMGVLEDTIWVITADHGENFHDHGQVTHGKTLYDTEARVPFLIHWPRGLAAADLVDPVSHLDILPTLLHLLDLPPHPAFQGRSVLETADPAQRASAIYINIQGLKSAEAIVCWPWKLIVNRSDKTTELFQLEQDPEERVNRVERDREIAEALRSTLSAQIAAQLAYHRKDNSALAERFAPRLLACPNLPEVKRAEAPGSSPERKN